MELFDLLEKQISELLKEVSFLKEENKTLKLTSVGLAELREENRALREALEHEQNIRENISSRVDHMLTMISEHKL